MQRASKELARGPRVEGLQSDAAVTVEAAEYAYKRLLLECARHGAAPSTLLAEPTLEIAAEPARKVEPAAADEREPLAA
jgi:hypothetical protein